MRKFISFVALTSLFVILICTPICAQTTAGSIVGSVVDPSGAPLASAPVTITNLGTGEVFKTRTESSGDYVVTPLAVGQYSVAVAAPGFKEAVRTNITLNVQDRLRLNFKLEVGSVSQSIVVSSTTPLLQTDTSALGQVVDSRTVDALPLNGRFVTQLAVLTAGVNPTTPAAPDSATGGFSANGVRPYENNYILDGVDDNNMQSGLTSGSTYVIMPPPDTIGEFKLQINSMSAEFGRSAGGVMNITTKSGTNKLRGSLFEFFRNSALDAKNYFDPATSPIPAYKQNQFGGTIGGPVVIPKVYDGRNKTFFSFDYQGTRIRLGQTLFATVPPMAWRTGNFSGFQSIFDPATTSVVHGVATRQQFPGNQIPLSRFDPVAVKLFNMLPVPSMPGNVSPSGVANNLLTNPSQKNDSNGFDVRIDQQISSSNSIFFRFSFSDHTLVNPGALPQPLYDGSYLTGTTVTQVRAGVLGFTHIFNPRTVNEVRSEYLYNNSALRPFNSSIDGAAELGIPGIPFTPGNGGYPAFGVAGINGFGGSTYSATVEVQNEFLLLDTLSLVRSVHTLKIGAEVRPRVDFSFLQPIAPRGNFSFSGNFTRDPNNLSGTGLGVADLALGIPTQSEITSSENDHFQEPAYAAFVQDDVKATDKLTLNLGLRYQFVSSATEKNNAQANFNLATRSLDIVRGNNTPLPSNFDFADIPVNRNASRTLVPNNYLDFAPRVGFAYNVVPKTVLSGGYGMFFSSFEPGPLSDPNPGLNPPFHSQSTFTAPSLVEPNPSVPQLSGGFPSDALANPDTASFFAIGVNAPGFPFSLPLKDPYVMDWMTLPPQNVLHIAL
ncbi:MAG: TonB-dependent receptor [Acidobacteriaceae bacterium]